MDLLVRGILPTVGGLGLLVFTWAVHPFAWELTVHPIWRWILCALGVLTPGATFWWVAIEEEEWGIWWSLLAVGLVVVLVGWYLEIMLRLLPYFCGVLLYLLGVVLVSFGAWQAWDEWKFWRTYRMPQYGEDAANSYDRASDWFDSPDDDWSHEYQDEERADNPQDNAFGPREWARGVLGIPANATEDEVRRAHKEQMERNHPDKVSHLGAETQERATRMAQDINKAKDILLPGK